MPTKTATLKQVICYAIIMCVMSAGIYIWMFAGAGAGAAAVLAMMYTPGIAAVLTALIFREKIGGFGWKPGKARFLVYAYLLPVLVSILGYVPVWLTRCADFTAEAVRNYKWAAMLGFDLPAPFIAGLVSKMSLAFFLTVVPVFGEEAGWSGFLTPRLRSLLPVPAVSLLVGGMMAAWHYPAIIGGIYGSGSPLWAALPGFTLAIVGMAFMRTVLVEKSSSLWTGVVLHASHNVVLMGMFREMTRDTGCAGYLVTETGLFLGLVYVVAALFFWRTHEKGRHSPAGRSRISSNSSGEG